MMYLLTVFLFVIEHPSLNPSAVCREQASYGGLMCTVDKLSIENSS